MLLAAAGVALAIVLGYSHITSPFNRFTIIRLPYRARFLNAVIEARNRTDQLRVRQQWWWRAFAIVKCGIHILHTRYISNPGSSGASVETIVQDIHALRFNPDRLLVISGDHFNGLFVRNLGVFYYPLIDPNLPSTNADWENRQLVYLQSVAYGLGVFSKYRVPTTTIVSTSPYGATCVNFYAYPSDTVYGLLYALATLIGHEASWKLYGYSAAKPHRPATKLAALALLAESVDTLRDLYAHYRTTVFNEASGLVRTDVHLSGAKDITRRTCAFYDNVVFWKTTQLAMALELIPHDEAFLTQLKRTILDNFWYEPGGYFLEDLSPEGIKRHYYSSDWLAVLFTGFLSVDDPAERPYFERSIQYLQHQRIDRPFGVRYQPDTRASRQFLIVRLSVASYGGDAIWSFWGMEYIKCLLLLHRATGSLTYLKTADAQIASYRAAILKHSGFPEVYNDQGNPLQTPLYRSIRQTGWVVGFEQVLIMRQCLAGSAGSDQATDTST